MARLTAGAPFVHPDCEITDATFGAYVEIGRASRVAHSTIGDYSYCDRMADIANAEVGKFSNIASCVRIGATDHPMDKASLHHFHYRSADYFDDAEHDTAWFDHRRTRRAIIGHDTWLGHGAQVRPQVSIGHGAVVAGGAIVTRDVPPYMIVAGIPALPLRARYTRPVAERMMVLAWWDWPHDRLRETLEDFRALSAEAFLEKYE
ncbi:MULTISPECIES: chloramphenicol acetyltransferase [Roseobacteraceae]|uniref:Streptogramin A acetyltransferase n=1 Tax=Pseudosulfitobacter pseudonitzschiae TaxID=1402135 RepID=A0A221JZN7_9RHOB|nr:MULTISPECIES: chloramphenicol acetyltransferase [Roseobacteraceae]ASM72195.1 streptogramin A acetyltransferase [Pseudosulfitobacter pseudonitzschiae]